MLNRAIVAQVDSGFLAECLSVKRWNAGLRQFGRGGEFCMRDDRPPHPARDRRSASPHFAYVVSHRPFSAPDAVGYVFEPLEADFLRADVVSLFRHS
jgi:hypothetical protein